MNRTAHALKMQMCEIQKFQVCERPTTATATATTTMNEYGLSFQLKSIISIII